jgi:hypothetical protein
VEVYKVQRGGERDCPACQRRARGYLGPLQPAHTCLTHRTPSQIADAARRKRLAQLDRRQS